jgi:hypothetical protein
MFNRRKLFGFAAAAPVAVIGVGAQKAQANNAPSNAIMTLEQGNPNYRMLLHGGSDKEIDKHKVSLSIGKDGHLWLKVNGEWKRVSLDG